jgi:hypothetical protein
MKRKEIREYVRKAVESLLSNPHYKRAEFEDWVDPKPRRETINYCKIITWALQSKNTKVFCYPTRVWITLVVITTEEAKERDVLPKRRIVVYQISDEDLAVWSSEHQIYMIPGWHEGWWAPP